MTNTQIALIKVDARKRMRPSIRHTMQLIAEREMLMKAITAFLVSDQTKDDLDVLRRASQQVYAEYPDREKTS